MTDINRATQAFQPMLGPNASTVSATSGAGSSGTAVALPTQPGAASSTTAQDTPTQFAVYNSSASVIAFIAFGPSTVAATTPSGATPGSYPVPPSAPGLPTIISVPGNPAYAAIIAASAITCYITPGYGKN